MKNYRISFVVLFVFIVCSLSAQRLQQPLGRGVVAVKNGEKVFVSWRKLAQEAETAQYNLYTRTIGSDSYTRVNDAPLSVTNYSTTTSVIPTGHEIAVAVVVDGVEQPMSDAYAFTGHDMRSVFMEITYDTLLSHNEYTTKFIWPADLTGDGEYDYVVDRRSTTGNTHKIEGYTRMGEHLWTVDMGPNVDISAGHDDMVIAYDMDCDGRSEVVIKSSDGTRFWDKTNDTWGAYLKGSADGDTDGDGIIDYNTQSVKNPPQYITVVDGLTGAEVVTIEMPFPSDGTDTYSRTNKANYMDTPYNLLNGHMGICYLDGVHPSVAMEYMVRTTDKTHHYYVSAWGYDFSSGKAGAWKEHFTWSRNDKTPWPAEFHHIRIGDVDRDGKDEILDGGFVVDDNGEMLFSAGISHGDRFRMGDIDPDRPGLETFAIQQNAGDMLGQILYDASTGESIKKWYLAAVGDVGRGECMDVDSTHKGYEMWSTMGNLYDCKGELITEGSMIFPTEGVWWDGSLDRERLASPDGNGFNAYVGKFNNTRLIEMAKISNWTVSSTYGVRPMYFGDMIGDWRDEVILRRGDETGCSGIVGFTTDYPTDVALYCLQQNPAYRMQCTTRGYYQSPLPDYYLGYDMPTPPLPPSMVTDVVWRGGSEWSVAATDAFVSFARDENTVYADGKSVLFDISGDASQPITINETLLPSAVYVMTPRGQQYTWTGTGGFAGDMELWKSMEGTLVVNMPLRHTGKTIISEGTLALNDTIKSLLDLRARGTLAGNAVVAGDCVFEGALNYEGCRLSPGTEAEPFGVITFEKGLALTDNVYLEMNLQTADTIVSDLITINGDFSLSGVSVINMVTAEARPLPGEYVLIRWSGEITGSLENLAVKGLKGFPYELQIQEKSIVLVVKEQRSASTGVHWTGTFSGAWDFETENFSLADEATTFVAGDAVTFDDNVTNTVISTDDLYETTGLYFNNTTAEYVQNGAGGFSGTGGLTKSGAGTLIINSTKNDYTGTTILNGGTTVVAALSDAGQPSSLGASGVLQLQNATLSVNNANTSTDSRMSITDSVSLDIQKGYTSLKGLISGNGTLVKRGNGQLNITYGSANTYKGGTVVEAGTLAQGSYTSTFGALGSSLVMKGGTVQIFNNNNTSQIPNFNYKVTVPEGADVTLAAGQRCYINGSFSGAGTIRLTIPYVRTDMKASWSSFTGRLYVTGSDFRLCSAMSMKGTTVDLGDGVTMGHFKSGSGSSQSLTSSIGALSSSSTTATVKNGTYNVGYNHADATFAGVLSSSVNKYGTGTWTLTGGSNTSSNIGVYAGVLSVDNASGAAANKVTVQNGAMLRGTGIVKSVSLQKGAVLAPGSTDEPGTLSVSGTVSGATGATLVMRITATGNDRLSVGGNLSLGSDTLRIVADGRTFAPGDEITLFAVTGTTTGTFIIDGTPGEGLVWDGSRLTSDGVIAVAEVSGIKSPGEDRVRIYPQVVEDNCHIDATRACSGIVMLSITDAAGRVVCATTFQATEPQSVDMSAYAPGVYYITLTHNGDHKTFRVVKK